MRVNYSDNFSDVGETQMTLSNLSPETVQKHKRLGSILCLHGCIFNLMLASNHFELVLEKSTPQRPTPTTEINLIIILLLYLIYVLATVLLPDT